MAASTGQRTHAQLKEHYEIEKELAARLRTASKQERQSLYGVVYDERAKRIPHHPLVTRANDPEQQALAVAPQLRLLRHFAKPNIVFLEVGPGDCAVAIAYARYVKQVYAVDISAALITATEQPSNFEFRLSTGTQVPLPPGSVDIAYSNDVMEHLHPDDAHDQLQSIRAAMAPGGRYICVTPNRLSGPHDISQHFDEQATGFHLREYTIAELAQSMRDAGFRRVKTLVSYQGHVLAPLLPVAPFAVFEALLARLPRFLRVKLARNLAAVKVVGVA